MTDWLGRVDHELAVENSVYEDPPDLSRVRLLRFQLPPGFVPSVEGVTFSLQDQESDSRDNALMGNAPGDFGFRFDVFRAGTSPFDRLEGRNGTSIEIVMCLLQYADSRPGIFGGYSITYYVRKTDDGWVAELLSVIT